MSYVARLNQQWNEGEESGSSLPDDLGFITALVATLYAENAFPAEKVFAFGMSNGAGMAAYLACNGLNIRGFGMEVGHYFSICNSPAIGVPVAGWSRRALAVAVTAQVCRYCDRNRCFHILVVKCGS